MDRRGTKGKKAANMEDLLKDSDEAAQRVFEAVQNCDPDNNYFDKMMYNRIVNETGDHSNLGAQLAK